METSNPACNSSHQSFLPPSAYSNLRHYGNHKRVVLCMLWSVTYAWQHLSNPIFVAAYLNFEPSEENQSFSSCGSTVVKKVERDGLGARILWLFTHANIYLPGPSLVGTRGMTRSSLLSHILRELSFFLATKQQASWSGRILTSRTVYVHMIWFSSTESVTFVFDVFSLCHAYVYHTDFS